MYLAEFTFPGTLELVNDLYIKGSEAEALEFAQNHATCWGVELFSLVEVTQHPAKLPKLSAENIILRFPPLLETFGTAS